jgi:hypothetical protein
MRRGCKQRASALSIRGEGLSARAIACRNSAIQFE